MVLEYGDCGPSTAWRVAAKVRSRRPAGWGEGRATAPLQEVVIAVGDGNLDAVLAGPVARTAGDDRVGAGGCGGQAGAAKRGKDVQRPGLVNRTTRNTRKIQQTASHHSSGRSVLDVMRCLWGAVVPDRHMVGCEYAQREVGEFPGGGQEFRVAGPPVHGGEAVDSPGLTARPTRGGAVTLHGVRPDRCPGDRVKIEDMRSRAVRSVVRSCAGSYERGRSRCRDISDRRFAGWRRKAGRGSSACP